MSWISKLSQISISIELDDYPEKVKYYLLDLAYSSMAKGGEYQYTDEMAEKDSSRLILETQNNMKQIENRIRNALSRISWNGSPIIIKPLVPLEDSIWGNWTEPIVDAQIQIGVGRGMPTFTLFVHDNEIMVKDILDAGDEDFFTDNKIEQDYFSLVRELKDPGSMSSGKILTLYTARPTEDRGQYYNNNFLPPNIFLTTSLDRARGIASELGRGGLRDIWKVRIEERHLIPTLETPFVKDYQIVGTGQIPVRSMTLIDSGD